MRLNRSILIATSLFAASGGIAFAQTAPGAPMQTAPDQVQPAPEMMPPPQAPPPPVFAPPPMAAPAPAPMYAYPPDVVPPPWRRWMPASGFGLALMAGGGVTDFTEGPTRAQTNTGGSWTVRMAFGTRSILGFEGSYIGGENPINTIGAGSATLVRNGIEGALRINLPLYAQGTLMEPYVLGGVGWNGYRVTNFNASATASVTSGTDNTVSVPLGVGFMVGYHGFLADLRYTIRPTYDQNIFFNQASSGLSNWDLGGMLGYEF